MMVIYVLNSRFHQDLPVSPNSLICDSTISIVTAVPAGLRPDMVVCPAVLDQLKESYVGLQLLLTYPPDTAPIMP